MDPRVAEMLEATSVPLTPVAVEKYRYIKVGAGDRKALAYMYPQKGRVKLLTSKRLAESVGLSVWDKESNQWFGAGPSIEVFVPDGDQQAKDSTIRLLDALARSVQG